MNDLPQTIQIGPIPYTIKVMEELHNGSAALSGQIDYNAQLIRIAQDLAPTTRWAVMWHEVLHGILEQAGIRDHDEQLIEALSYGIVEALQDNPYLRDGQPPQNGFDSLMLRRITGLE